MNEKVVVKNGVELPRIGTASEVAHRERVRHKIRNEHVLEAFKALPLPDGANRSDYLVADVWDKKEVARIAAYVRHHAVSDVWYVESSSPKGKPVLMLSKVRYPVLRTKSTTPPPERPLLSAEMFEARVTVLERDVERLSEIDLAEINAKIAALDARIEKWALEPTEVKEALNGEIERLDKRIDRVAVGLTRI